MNELLNRYGLSDDFGFAISFEMLHQFFDSEKDYSNFLKQLEERVNNIKNIYGIPDSIDLKLPVRLAVQTQNGIKRIIIDKESLLRGFEDYFSSYLVSDSCDNLCNIFFDEINEKQWLDTAIADTKELIAHSIEQLKNVRTFEELKGISFTLYNAYLKAYNETKNNRLCVIPWHIWFPSELQKDIDVFKRIKLWFPRLIDDLSKKTISDDLFDKINIDKFKLFLTCQYIEIANATQEPYRSLLIHNAIEIFNSIQNKEVNFDKLFLIRCTAENEFNWHCFENVNYTMLKNGISAYLAEPLGSIAFNTISTYKADNPDNGDYNKVYSDLNDLINKAILKSNEMGLKDVSLEEISNDAKEKLKKEQSIKKQKQLRSFIERAEFYQKEPNFYKCQKGNGIFQNSHILYYNNGVVAIDTLNGDYGCLYVMPINVYFEVISNNNIKNLTELRSIITVTPISHGRLDWKEIAHNEIQNHAITQQEFEILQSIEGISLPVNDIELENAKQKYKDNEYIYNKIIAKEKERKIKYKEIDDELRAKDNSDYGEETQALLAAEEEILENTSNPSDLVSIYDYENKIKTRRNPKVSLNTKYRTMVGKGMRCEMCGEVESTSTRAFAAHHIIPLSKGGIDNIYNTACLCGKCHDKIHDSAYPFTYEQKWQMLQNVRRNIERTTPYYLKDFDRLFNPNYNAIYNSNLTNEEQIKQYEEESIYYNEHKKEEDEKFLTEYNCFKK